MESRSMTYPLLKSRRLTVADFREIELNAPEEERWELIDGTIIRSFAGGTIRHNVIIQNMAFILQTSFRRTGARPRAYSQSVRLDSDALRFSALPDVVVSSNPASGDATTITEATAIVEVLSVASRGLDKGAKLDSYLAMPNVKTVVLVEPEMRGVVSYTRVSNGFLRRDFSSPDDSVAFDGLNVSMTLAEIYEDVEFDQA